MNRCCIRFDFPRPTVHAHWSLWVLIEEVINETDVNSRHGRVWA